MKEWLYWYEELKSKALIFNDTHESDLARAITASNLTIASLKFMEE